MIDTFLSVIDSHIGFEYNEINNFMGEIHHGIIWQVQKKEVVHVPSENVYVGEPHFYEKKDGTPFGAFSLTEGTLTALPKDPKSLYAVDNQEVTEWKLMLVSITNNGVLGDVEYYAAIDKLKKFSVGENDKNILIKGLSLEELTEIL